MAMVSWPEEGLWEWFKWNAVRIACDRVARGANLLDRKVPGWEVVVAGRFKEMRYWEFHNGFIVDILHEGNLWRAMKDLGTIRPWKYGLLVPLWWEFAATATDALKRFFRFRSTANRMAVLRHQTMWHNEIAARYCANNRK